MAKIAKNDVFSGLSDIRKGWQALFYSHEVDFCVLRYFSVLYIVKFMYLIFLLENLKMVFAVEHFIGL